MNSGEPVIGFLTYDSAPYRIHQLNKFSTKYKINVYYLTEKKSRAWDLNFEKKFSETRLKGFIGKRRSLVHLGLLNLVKSNDLIIIGGYDTVSSFIVLFLCKFLRKKTVLLMDGYLQDKQENYFKNKLKKLFFKNIDAFFGNGKVTYKLAKQYDFPDDLYFNQILSVDNKKIYSSLKISGKLKSDLKKKNSGKKVIIYSGRILKRKNIELVIEALSLIERKEEFIFLLIGDGPNREGIEKKALEKDVEIIITGFIKDQEELFSLYGLGDLLVLPSSEEVWGLVVNEGMAAGLPIIVSDKCGCSLDLVIESENGHIITGNDSLEVSKKIVDCINNKEKYSMKSLEIISNWTYDKSLDSFNKMIEKVYSV